MATVNPYITFLGNCEEALNKIMRITLPISNETLLMGSDTGGEWAAKTEVGNNITISITADTKEQADHFFNSLSEGGKVNMPMELTFWGSYFGMCTDKFDINWMISFGQAPKE
jgi:PhnB protein